MAKSFTTKFDIEIPVVPPTEVSKVYNVTLRKNICYRCSVPLKVTISKRVTCSRCGSTNYIE